jgi:hypothetical protein
VQLRVFLGAASLVLALGAIVIGYGVVIPGLEQSVDAGLIDGNLRVALTEPIERRLTTLILVASVGIAAAFGPWAPPPTPARASSWTSHLTGTLALVLLFVSAALRLWIVPGRLAAWARVDVVTGRPALALEQALTWNTSQSAALAAALALIVALAAVTTSHPREPQSAR